MKNNCHSLFARTCVTLGDTTPKTQRLRRVANVADRADVRLYQWCEFHTKHMLGTTHLPRGPCANLSRCPIGGMEKVLKQSLHLLKSPGGNKVQ